MKSHAALPRPPRTRVGPLSGGGGSCAVGGPRPSPVAAVEAASQCARPSDPGSPPRRPPGCARSFYRSALRHLLWQAQTPRERLRVHRAQCRPPLRAPAGGGDTCTHQPLSPGAPPDPTSSYPSPTPARAYYLTVQRHGLPRTVPSPPLGHLVARPVFPGPSGATTSDSPPPSTLHDPHPQENTSPACSGPLLCSTAAPPSGAARPAGLPSAAQHLPSSPHLCPVPAAAPSTPLTAHLRTPLPEVVFHGLSPPPRPIGSSTICPCSTHRRQTPPSPAARPACHPRGPFSDPPSSHGAPRWLTAPTPATDPRPHVPAIQQRHLTPPHTQAPMMFVPQPLATPRQPSPASLDPLSPKTATSQGQSTQSPSNSPSPHPTHCVCVG